METSADDKLAVADLFSQWQASFETLRWAERRLVLALRSTADSRELGRLAQDVDALRSTSSRLFAQAELGGFAQSRPAWLRSK